MYTKELKAKIEELERAKQEKCVKVKRKKNSAIFVLRSLRNYDFSFRQFAQKLVKDANFVSSYKKIIPFLLSFFLFRRVILLCSGIIILDDVSMYE